VLGSYASTPIGSLVQFGGATSAKEVIQQFNKTCKDSLVCWLAVALWPSSLTSRRSHATMCHTITWRMRSAIDIWVLPKPIRPSTRNIVPNTCNCHIDVPTTRSLSPRCKCTSLPVWCSAGDQHLFCSGNERILWWDRRPRISGQALEKSML